jgi:hypothetical protein
VKDGENNTAHRKNSKAAWFEVGRYFEDSKNK